MAKNTITVNGKLYALVVTNATVPVVESPKIECIEPGCYKEGHLFSPLGAFGVADASGEKVVKGHFDLNPTHAFKTH